MPFNSINSIFSFKESFQDENNKDLALDQANNTIKVLIRYLFFVMLIFAFLVLIFNNAPGVKDKLQSSITKEQTKAMKPFLIIAFIVVTIITIVEANK